MRSRTAAPSLSSCSLIGKTLGIIGLGTLGTGY